LLEDDKVLTKVEGSLQGAQTIYEHFDATNQRATVYVRYPVKGEGGLTQALLPGLRTVPPPPGSTGQLFEPPASQPAKPVTGDGLIVDVSDHAFRPALVNHILTENGDNLYDPSKIASSILVERGSGDDTNEVSKAKAILAKHDSQSPLIVKAQRVIERTSVEVSAADAIAIYTADLEHNFLAGAKVVFVIR
jgi:hypothetical protein